MVKQQLVEEGERKYHMRRSSFGVLLRFIVLSSTVILLGIFLCYRFIRDDISSYDLIVIIKPSNIEECYCQYKSKSYKMCYAPSFAPNLLGKRFNCNSLEFLNYTDLLEPKTKVDLENEDFSKVPILTAASENHVEETKEMLYFVRKLWPEKKVIFYDLGLTEVTRNELKTYCNFELRTFPFELFPPYVRNLKEYRWKPLIIAMTLLEFDTIWYMDSSVRWLKAKMDKYYEMIRCRNNLTGNDGCAKSSLLMLTEAGHGIYTSTHPGMYSYLATDLERIKSVTELGATIMLIANTRESKELLKWWVLCALEKECMAPENSKISCNFGRDRYSADPVCHRYDQSAINILLANQFNFNVSRYFANYSSPFDIRRSASAKIDSERLKNCSRRFY